MFFRLRFSDAVGSLERKRKFVKMIWYYWWKKRFNIENYCDFHVPFFLRKGIRSPTQCIWKTKVAHIETKDKNDALISTETSIDCRKQFVSRLNGILALLVFLSLQFFIFSFFSSGPPPVNANEKHRLNGKTFVTMR